LQRPIKMGGEAWCEIREQVTAMGESARKTGQKGTGARRRERQEKEGSVGIKKTEEQTERERGVYSHSVQRAKKKTRPKRRREMLESPGESSKIRRTKRYQMGDEEKKKVEEKDMGTRSPHRGQGKKSRSCGTNKEVITGGAGDDRGLLWESTRRKSQRQPGARKEQRGGSTARGMPRDTGQSENRIF